MNKTREIQAQFGYLKNGMPRHSLPSKFWKHQKWEIPAEVLPCDYEIECMQTDAVTRYLCSSIPNLKITQTNVSVWFAPSQRNKIPGVYRFMVGDQNRVYIHRSIVYQMQKALLSSDELIWEHTGNANTADANQNAEGINSDVVKELKEKVSVLFERVREIRKDNSAAHELMRQEYRSRIEHLFYAVEELYKQFNLTIPERTPGKREQKEQDIQAVQDGIDAGVISNEQAGQLLMTMARKEQSE